MLLNVTSGPMFKSARGHSKVLEAVRAITPAIAADAANTEANKALDPALMDRLCEAGVFRMILPKALGGEAMDPFQVLRVVEELARADAVAGWTAMIASGNNILLGLLPSSAIDEVLAGGPDLKIRGAMAPKGRFVEVEGGYRVSGQWPLASGSYKHDWVMGNGVIFDGPAPRMVNGMPAMVLALVPADQARFLDTWDAVGLRATASNDFVLDDVFVPTSRAGNLMGKSAIDSPFHRLPFPAATAGQHTAVSTGCAMGALEDLAKLALTKRPAFKPGQTLIQDPAFLARFGELLARLDAARSYADHLMEESWELAQSGQPITQGDVARVQSMVTWVSLECVNIVNDAFTLGGASVAYASSPIQRRWRDVRVVAQHAAASLDAYSALAAAFFDGEMPKPGAAEPHAQAKRDAVPA